MSFLYRFISKINIIYDKIISCVRFISKIDIIYNKVVSCVRFISKISHQNIPCIVE